jgi:hypothetical protein
MTSQVHIINKQVFDLRMPSRENAFAVQGRVSELYQEKILPILNKVLNELVPPGEVIVIDKIEIDLETIAEHELEEKLPVIFAGKIREELAAHLRSPAKKIASSVSNIELLKQFLQSGKLPWWAGKQQPDPGQLVEDLLVSNSRQLISMLKEISSNAHTIERLAAQSPGKVFDKLAGSLLQLIADADKEVIMQCFEVLFRASAITSTERKNYIRLQSLLAVVDNALLSFSPVNEASAIEKHLHAAKDEDRYDTSERTISSLSSTKPVLSSLKKSFATRVIITHAAMLAAGNDHTEAISLVKKVVREISLPGSKQLIAQDQESPGRKKEEKRAESIAGEKDKKQKRYKESKSKALNKRKLSTEDNTYSSEAQESEEREMSKLLEDEIKEMKQHTQAAAVNEKVDDDTDAAYISNAGLVLLAPFFPAFFRSLDLVEGKEFKDHNAALRAVHLLQYLATGNTSTHEYALVFNKLLCGMQVNESIGTKIKLTKKERSEADQLIADAITHWKALKNTSVSYFRSAFLEREGILTRNEQGWLLRVERKPYDMLLESLPWGLSMIKLPWTKEMFNVEW